MKSKVNLFSKHTTNSLDKSKSKQSWISSKLIKKTFKNFMAPFYGWGSTASRLEPLQGGSLLFTNKFPEIPGTHFIDHERRKGWVNLGATQFIYHILLYNSKLWFMTWTTMKTTEDRTDRYFLLSTALPSYDGCNCEAKNNKEKRIKYIWKEDK